MFVVVAMAAAAAGVVGGNGSSASWMQFRNRDRKQAFCCSYSSSSVKDPSKTLTIQPGASETEVRKAFRLLCRLVIFSILNLLFLSKFRVFLLFY